MKSIRARILSAFLLLTTLSLTFLGAYLLHFFHAQNLACETQHLIANAKIVESTLEANLYDPAQEEFVQQEIQKITAVTGLRVTILRADGSVAADSWEDSETLGNHLSREEVRAALASAEYATATRYSDTIGQNLLYVAVPVRTPDGVTGIVRIASTLAPIEENFSATRRFILSALALATALALAVGIWLAHRYAKPIRSMTRSAQAIADGALQQRIHLRTGDELEHLAHAINQLTAHLEDKILEAHAEAEKLSLILENMDNAVILLDSHGNVAAVNRRAAELFHLTPDLLGKHSISALGSSLLTSAAQEVFATGRSKSVELRTAHNFQAKTFQVFFAPVVSKEKRTGVLAVFHDISVLQELYDRQIAFVASASHELATPLTSIRGFAETLLDGALEEEALRREFVNIIHDEAQRMSRLVSDLLQLAKLDTETYRNQIALEQVDLRQIFSEVSKRLAPHYEKKRQRFTLCCGDGALCVRANYHWIMQLMMNLSENAVKYTPEGGNITLRCRREVDRIHVCVTDDGVGIAPADQPLIFERFYRADKARARAAGGSGLGLSLARFIVEMFGGTISVESAPGLGSAFHFNLPASDPDQTPR